jgi:hypothetical protein
MSYSDTLGDEYEWDTPRQSNYLGMTYDETTDILDSMTDEDAEEIGFPGGVDDLWDFINQQFTLTEE